MAQCGHSCFYQTARRCSTHESSISFGYCRKSRTPCRNDDTSANRPPSAAQDADDCSTISADRHHCRTAAFFFRGLAPPSCRSTHKPRQALWAQLSPASISPTYGKKTSQCFRICRWSERFSCSPRPSCEGLLFLLSDRLSSYCPLSATKRTEIPIFSGFSHCHKDHLYQRATAKEKLHGIGQKNIARGGKPIHGQSVIRIHLSLRLCIMSRNFCGTGSPIRAAFSMMEIPSFEM